MTVATATSPTALDRALSWLRQGSTQAGLQAIGLSVLGYASGTTPLWTVLTAVPVGIVGLLWPEQPAVQREVQSLANDAVQVAAASNPRIAATLGLRPVKAAGSP